MPHVASQLLLLVSAVAGGLALAAGVLLGYVGVHLLLHIRRLKKMERR